ncbi:Lar family restriction alleviation protein [Pseudomonas fulva]|uniref:Lar family restriction alleviation protein n=1 Tax=Pseudomonas fulva TaxID=47880 RepID=UPI003D2EA7B4
MPTENRSSNTEMVSELLPCPFCGQQDFLIERLDSDASVMICQGLTGPHEACLARGPVGVAQDEGEEQPGLDKAVELWNSRAERAACSIPDGYCLMPRALTAENGAKALLLGEFKLEVTQECPECRELDEPQEGCEICDGEGEYGQRHVIPWDKIKFIYSAAVKGLALKPGATSKTP